MVQPGLISACTSLDCSVVQRVNSEFLILTFPAFPEYEISYPETIELTATRDSVLSDQAISETVLIMRLTPVPRISRARSLTRRVWACQTLYRSARSSSP